MDWFYTCMDSPVGLLRLVARNGRLVALLWPGDKAGRAHPRLMPEDAQYPVLREARAQLLQYFDGERRQFELDLEFDGTPFQQSVWRALLTIPYGETRSYREIALQIGRANAMRAVGAANGSNPISIIVPCHRVIGAGGDLTGFGGGLPAKRFLLTHEGHGELAPGARLGKAGAAVRAREGQGRLFEA